MCPSQDATTTRKQHARTTNPDTANTGHQTATTQHLTGRFAATKQPLRGHQRTASQSPQPHNNQLAALRPPARPHRGHYNHHKTPAWPLYGQRTTPRGHQTAATQSPQHCKTNIRPPHGHQTMTGHHTTKTWSTRDSYTRTTIPPDNHSTTVSNISTGNNFTCERFFSHAENRRLHADHM